VKPKQALEVPNDIAANAPITVTYISSKDTISRTYLRVANEILFSCVKPTAFDVYKILVGTYYCFDRAYPVASKGVFDFLDACVLQKTVYTNRSPALVKQYIAQYNTLKDANAT